MHNLDRAINSAPGGNPVVGNIARGEVVTVEVPEDATGSGISTDVGSADVGPRRTGAILIGMELIGDCERKWGIVGTTLTVEHNAASNAYGTYTFWVF